MQLDQQRQTFRSTSIVDRLICLHLPLYFARKFDEMGEPPKRTSRDVESTPIFQVGGRSYCCWPELEAEIPSLRLPALQPYMPATVLSWQERVLDDERLADALDQLAAHDDVWESAFSDCMQLKRVQSDENITLGLTNVLKL